MERLTTYHCDIAVIKDKELLTQAMARLAAYEDTGLTPSEVMDGKLLTGWIPIGEKLPDDCVEVLVTTGMYVYMDCYDPTDGCFERVDNVVAWMPLPEPYKEDKP